MSRRQRQVALLKVLAAAAWADGRLDRAEINHLKDLMLAYGLEDADVREIDALLAAPVSSERCRELTRDLLGMLEGGEAREEVLEEVERLFLADGVMDDDEREVLENLRGVMGSMNAVDGFLTRITGVFRRVFAGRDPGGAGPEAWPRNAVFRRVDDLSAGGWREEIDAPALNRITLHAAVLGRVAAREDGVSDAERERIRIAVGRRFEVDGRLLEWITRAACEVRDDDEDRQGLLSEVNRVSDLAERIRLLDDAFAVAAGDGVLGDAELEELRLVSNYLWIDPRDFNEIRRRRTPHAAG